jgi:hypothetical protein
VIVALSLPSYATLLLNAAPRALAPGQGRRVREMLRLAVAA